MTLVAVPGMAIPPLLQINTSGGIAVGFASNALIDATGEKIAFNGRIWWPNYSGSGTKNISKVGFRFGPVTKAGGSGLTVSLQDTSMTTGPFIQPDGTQDQTVAIANGDAGFVSNSWYQTSAFNAVRAVGYGDFVSVVIEFDGSGRLGSDSVVVSTLNTGIQSASEAAGLFSAGSWANVSQGTMDLLFEFDDGTFGSFRSSWPVSASTIVSANSGTTPDEWAEKITVPIKCVVDGVYALVYSQSASADFTVSLENGSGTVLAGPYGVDYNAMTAANSVSWQRISFPTPVTFNAGDTVYICFKPTTANTVAVAAADVANVSYWQAFQWGGNHNAASRKSGGAWTQNTSRRLQAHLSVQKVDDGAGAGGGLLVNPGMRGGMI